jgi:hypothetical protein
MVDTVGTAAPRALLSSVLGLLLLAGCATPGAGGTAGTAQSPSSVDPSGCPRTLMLTDEDTQTTVCVAVGGTVSVSLAGAPGQEWKPLQRSGTGLTEQPPASVATAGTIAFYRATAAGSAQLSSSRSACPAASPGAVSCHALQAFTVTVDIR